MFKYKYITSTGEDAFESFFDEAGWFDVYGYAGVRKEQRTFFINAKGINVLDAKYGLTMFDNNGLGLVHINKNGTLVYGMLSVNGQLLIPMEYEGLGYVSHNLFCASIKKEHLCLDRAGHKVFSLDKYKFVDDYEFRDGLVLVQYNGKYFYMDTKGKIVHGPYWSAQ